MGVASLHQEFDRNALALGQVSIVRGRTREILQQSVGQ